MITIYAEKPDVGNKIAAALGGFDCGGTQITSKNLKTYEKKVKAQQHKDGYLKTKFDGQETIVTWGYGHLCELKQAKDYNADYKNWNKLPKPFIPSSYDIKVKEDAKKQYNIVKRFFEKSSYIINATDYDREGELIFGYLYQVIDCKVPFKRAHFSSQTEEGLREAFDNLKTSDEVRPMTEAGMGRSVADWLIGSNLTVAMTLQNHSKSIVSVGRVQTPTLQMLVTRENEINEFKPEPYYILKSEFKIKENETYIGEYKEKKITSKEKAESIFAKINKKPGIVSKIESKEEKKQAPLLFNLSTLQMEANQKYNFTLAKTLSLAQSLYEKGFTTYPRTDSQFLTEDMVPVIHKTLDQLEKNSTYAPFITGKTRQIQTYRYLNDKKVTSHFAIIPTGKMPSGLTTDESSLYDLIVRSFLVVMYPPAIVENSVIETEVNGELFITKGTKIVDVSWMSFRGSVKEKFLPMITKGTTVSSHPKLENKMTVPPKRYTDKTLVAGMIGAGKTLDDEELKEVMANGIHGIGTEATRASIIETLIHRQYAKRQGKQILPTEKGIQMLGMLPLEDIKSAKMTAQWEQRLNEIALGHDSYDAFVKDIEIATKKWCDEIYAKECSITFNDNETDIKCPICGKPMNKFKWGYGCSGYKEGCKFSISNTVAKKKLTENQVKTLLTKGITNEIKGFHAKSGSLFSAKLKLDENKKIVFVFSNKKK